MAVPLHSIFVVNRPVDGYPVLGAFPSRRVRGMEVINGIREEDARPQLHGVHGEDSPFPTTEPQLRAGFMHFLISKTKELQELPEEAGASDKIRAASRKKTLQTVLVLVLDPELRPAPLSLPAMHGALDEGLTLEMFYSNRALPTLISLAKSVMQPWDADSSFTTKEGDSAADRPALPQVPESYGRCILTGRLAPLYGVHILPAWWPEGADSADFDRLWSKLGSLRPLWPRADRQSGLASDPAGCREKVNVLPMVSDARAMWDRRLFGLRPIIIDQAYPESRTRLYVQAVFFRDLQHLDCLGGLRTTPPAWSHGSGDHSFQDNGYRNKVLQACNRCPRGKGGMFANVGHGDIYEISTSRPDAFPLPSRHFLEIQYAVHRIMAGLRTPEVLRAIFSGEPPEIQGAAQPGLGVPPEWKGLIEAAIETRVLSPEAAAGWSTAFARESDCEALSLRISLSLRLNKSMEAE